MTSWARMRGTSLGFGITTARPIQAAMASAASFAVGAGLPLVMVLVAPAGTLIPAVSVASLALLSLLGTIGARAGGADPVGSGARGVLGCCGHGAYRRHRGGVRDCRIAGVGALKQKEAGLLPALSGNILLLGHSSPA